MIEDGSLTHSDIVVLEISERFLKARAHLKPAIDVLIPWLKEEFLKLKVDRLLAANARCIFNLLGD